jgi:putative flippase GtrA
MELTGQAIRFFWVGVFTNVGMYTSYLFITWAGLGHKLSMTLVYMSGVAIGFILNRRWTFRHEGLLAQGLLRYLLIYFLGYLVNLAGLYLLVDALGYPHQIIQLMLGVLLAIIFFVMQRYWVFSDKTKAIPDYVR